MVIVLPHGDAHGICSAEGVRDKETPVMAAKLQARDLNTMRRYITGLPEQETGWLAAARDPHRRKKFVCTQGLNIRGLFELAREDSLSLARLWNGSHVISPTPDGLPDSVAAAYGCAYSGNTSRGVADIASDVGYESEAAFNRR